MGYPRRLLGDDESLVLVLHPHIKVLVRPVLALLVLAALGTLAATFGFAAGGLWFWPTVVAIALLVIAALRWVAGPFIVWWATTYVITTDRLIIRTGVLNRTGHDMPLVRLNDISFSHTLGQRMLGCGSLTVESGGEQGQIKLVDIPQVEEVQRTLYRLSDAARASEARQVTVVVDGDDDEQGPHTHDRERDGR